jgi:hypothetical protein
MYARMCVVGALRGHGPRGKHIVVRSKSDICLCYLLNIDMP